MNVIDPNIPTTLGAGTNEDVILVYDSTQLLLFEEGAPAHKRVRGRRQPDHDRAALVLRVLRVHGQPLPGSASL
jgi:hypothetical protein